MLARRSRLDRLGTQSVDLSTSCAASSTSILRFLLRLTSSGAPRNFSKSASGTSVRWRTNTSLLGQDTVCLLLRGLVLSISSSENPRNSPPSSWNSSCCRRRRTFGFSWDSPVLLMRSCPRCAAVGTLPIRTRKSFSLC